MTLHEIFFQRSAISRDDEGGLLPSTRLGLAGPGGGLGSVHRKETKARWMIELMDEYITERTIKVFNGPEGEAALERSFRKVWATLTPEEQRTAIERFKQKNNV